MSAGNGGGPLPQVDQAATLQERSIVALQTALPADRLRFRREAAPDTGVDGSIEVLVESMATNCRANVQVKARSGTKEAEDGSIRLEADSRRV